MNFAVRFKRNPVRYLAIFAAIIGAIFVVLDFILNLYFLFSSPTNDLYDMLSILINFFINAFVIYMLLRGNTEDNSFAIRGFLYFIFLFVWDVLYVFLVDSAFFSIFSAAFLFNSVESFIYLFYLIFLLASIIIGIMTYINTRRFVMRGMVSFKKILILASLFLGCSVIYNIFTITSYYMMGFDDISLLLLIFIPIANIFLSVSAFLSIYRCRTI